MLTPLAFTALLACGCVAAFGATLTGFGFATLLTPVAAAFVPWVDAIVLIAFFHGANSFARFVLFRRHVRWAFVVWYGIPSMAAAALGARLLGTFRSPTVTLLFGAVLALYALLGFWGKALRLPDARSTLALGGLLSGLSAGLIGLQGAVRAVVLISSDLAKERFIATSAAIATLVDATRISVYITMGVGTGTLRAWTIPLFMVAAFAGSGLARRLLPHVSETKFRRVVFGALTAYGVWLVATSA